MLQIFAGLLESYINANTHSKLKKMKRKHLQITVSNKTTDYTHYCWQHKGLNRNVDFTSLIANYIKLKTSQSEEKYKKYKNKLVSLLRFCEKKL